LLNNPKLFIESLKRRYYIHSSIVLADKVSAEIKTTRDLNLHQNIYVKFIIEMFAKRTGKRKEY